MKRTYKITTPNKEFELSFCNNVLCECPQFYQSYVDRLANKTKATRELRVIAAYQCRGAIVELVATDHKIMNALIERLGLEFERVTGY